MCVVHSHGRSLGNWKLNSTKCGKFPYTLNHSVSSSAVHIYPFLMFFGFIDLKFRIHSKCKWMFGKWTSPALQQTEGECIIAESWIDYTRDELILFLSFTQSVSNFRLLRNLMLNRICAIPLGQIVELCISSWWFSCCAQYALHWFNAFSPFTHFIFLYSIRKMCEFFSSRVAPYI